jgi:hypothetical protein
MALRHLRRLPGALVWTELLAGTWQLHGPAGIGLGHDRIRRAGDFDTSGWRRPRRDTSGNDYDASDTPECRSRAGCRRGCTIIKDEAMARIARMVAVIALVIASLGSTGCLHTWAQTYQDYPPSAWEPPYTHPQGEPKDG